MLPLDHEVTVEEPLPGLVVLNLSAEYSQRLDSEYDIILPGVGFCTRTPPIYIVTFDYVKGEEEPMLPEDRKHKIKKHEIHHFLWNHLQKSPGMVREIQESSPERKEAFFSFRDEAIAYITSENIQNKEFIAIKDMVYTQNLAIQNDAAEALNTLAASRHIANLRGIPAHNFLHPVMTSENFEDLARRVQRIIPAGEFTPDELGDIMALSYDHTKSGYFRNVDSILANLGVTVDIEFLQQAYPAFLKKHIENEFKNGTRNSSVNLMEIIESLSLLGISGYVPNYLNIVSEFNEELENNTPPAQAANTLTQSEEFLKNVAVECLAAYTNISKTEAESQILSAMSGEDVEILTTPLLQFS